MPLQVVSIRASTARPRPSLPGLEPVVLNLTSRGSEPWVRFSPFYPHGDIPVPLSPGYTAASVEGIWQGLKVFEGTDINVTTFANTTMRGLKRTVRRFGPVRGHRAGSRVITCCPTSRRAAPSTCPPTAGYWSIVSPTWSSACAE